MQDIPKYMLDYARMLENSQVSRMVVNKNPKRLYVQMPRRCGKTLMVKAMTDYRNEVFRERNT